VKRNKIKFIIFGQSRSGSTLLLELLNSHPDINCEGELFNKFKLYIKTPLLLKFFTRYPFPYINYRMKKSMAPLYGFKLFFFQVHFPDKCLKQLADRGWKFIHVRRENILDQSLSNIIALETNYWHRRKDEINPNQAINIPPKRLLRVLKTRSNWRKRELNMMAPYDHVTVIYEKDLQNADQWQETAAKVYNYLGLNPVQVKTDLRPTDTRPYTERIENYVELMSMLKTSEFAYLAPRQ